MKKLNLFQRLRENSRTLRRVTILLALFLVSIGQMWGTDFDITLDQFRTTPISGLVKIDDSNLSLSGGALQLSSGNQNFIVSTTNSNYKIKEIVFTTSKAVISYGGDPISENTFTPASPGTSFTLNLAASGGTAKITQMVVTLTTSTSETLEALVATAIADGVYTTGSSVITLSTEGGSCNTSSGQEYINLAKSKSTRSLTIATSSSYNIKFIALAFYDAIFSRTITASTGTYTAASYIWTPGATPSNSVTLTFDTGNSEGAKIRRVLVGYESAGGGEEKDYTVTAATSTGTNTYGIVSAAASSLNEDETTTITATPATGYKVTNWAVSGTGASISPSGASNETSTTLTMGTENATVTATFGPKSYTVTLNNQSATSAGTESVTTTYNANTNLTSAITCPTKTSKVFAGYFTATNGGGVQLIDPAGNWIASAGGGSTYLDGSKNWKNDGNLTLYACWMEYASTFDIEAYVQTNVTEGTPLQTFTILGTNKLLYNLGGNTELDNSNDATGQYDGLKIKRSGDYVMFLVQANNTLYVKWGYVKSSKPKYSINGGAAQTFTTLSTNADNSSSPGDIEISSQSYDQLVKIWSTDGNATVLKKVTIESSCSATANAGADKATTYNTGVAMAATAASSGYTGAWSIKTGSPSTDDGQLGTTSSNTMTFTPASVGTYTLIWTVTDDSDGSCYATDEAAVTVSKADMPSTGLATGTATSITVSGATLPFTMTSTSGVGSLTIKVYDNNDDVVKTVTNITPATSGSQAVTGLSASTTYYYKITPIGDANHNDGDETSASSTFTTLEPACSAPTSPSISGTTSYTAGGTISLTASATGTDESTTYQWYKGDPENSGVSQGDASTGGATFTIDGCEVADAGTYYCVISNGDGCDVTVNQAITVAKAAMPTTGLATGTATSITTSGATLPFTMTSTSGVGSLTIKVYDDNDDVVKTVTNITPDISGSQAVTGLSAGTTYYYTITPIGDANHNDGSETSASSTFTTETVAYSVTYAANGGSGSVPTDANTYSPNAEVTVLGNTLSKSGYSFCGWSYNGYVYVEGDKFEITEDATLTAVWNQNATTVTLTHFGKQYYTSSPRRGYAYVGSTSGTKYIIESNSSDVKNSDGDSSAIVLPYSNKFLKVLGPGSTTSITDSLFSNVTQISFKWKYVGSTTTYTTGIDVYVGSTKVETKSLTGNKNDSYATATVSNIASLSGTVKFVNTGTSSSNQKFWLDDIAITYSASTYKKVSFNKGSGPSTVSGLPADRYVPSGSKISRPATDPTATNYIFDGWVTTSGGSSAFDFANTTITADKTIYAKWTAKTSPGSGTVSGTANICPGSNTDITLSTSVSGASYQLYKDNVASGDPKAGTGSALTWSVSAAGTYTVKAVETATHASATMSGSATVTIYTALSKTSDPTSSKSATVGVGCALDGLAYTGNANVACQWQSCTDVTPTSTTNISDGGAYSNCTTSAMTFTPASTGTYYFRCVVSDDCGSSFNTGVVTVTAKIAPNVYSLSGEPTALCGGTATLTLSGSDDGVTYKLYKGGVDQSDDKVGDGNEIEWTGISAAGTYTVKTVETSTYAEAPMSGSVTISIMTPTSISTQPTTSVTAHDGVNFTLGSDLVGAGEGDLRYQWYSYTNSSGDGEAAIGSATTTKTLTTSKSTGTYYYKVEVIGSCGSVKSNMITVTVDNEHLLSFSANSGSGSVPGSAYYAPSASVTLNSTTIPTRSGYVFLGWNTNSSGTGDMYQPGATYTMPETATTLHAAWGSPCFSFSKGTKNTEPTDGTVMTPENINSSAFKSGATLSGGTLTNTSGATLGINGDRGFVMIKSTRELTLTLTGGQFQAGTVITLEGYTNNENSKSYGFALGSVKVGGTKSTESTGAYTAFSQRYVVVADDGIEGTSSVVVKMNGDCTGSQTYLSAIYIGGCMSCTPLSSLALSYDNTTLYAFGGTPSTATASLTGNTGDGAVSYSSSNPDVVTVDSETGAIEAVGAGTATITALVAAVGDYCGGSATRTITVPALITQTINVATSSTGVAWGTPPDMTFTPSDKGMTQESVIANGTGVAAFTFDASETSNKNRNERYMTAAFTGSESTKGKYLTMSFSNDDYNVRLNEVVVPFQPITNDGKAQVEIYEDGVLQMTSTEVSGITKGQITDVHFSFASVKTLKAGATVEVRIYFYGQTDGFRLASPILVNGGVVTSTYTPVAEGEGVSNLWSDPANWDWGVAPTINNDVVINREFYVDVKNATAKSVTLTGDAQLIINAGMALTVAGNVTKDDSQTSVGDVVLHSTQAAGTGALIMNPATVTVAPKATVEQATKTGKIGNDWINQHVGTPFSDGNSYNNWYGSYVYYYDATGGSWVNVKRNAPEASLVPFRGYNVLRSDATTFWMQGTVNQPITDDVELSAVKNVGETTTENMFANSWLAPINILAMEDADFVNINKVIYIFNAGTPAQYAALSESGTTSADGGTAAAQWMALPLDAVKDDPSSFTYTVIPSMQGFKVLANAAEAKLKLNYDKLVYQPALDSLAAGKDLPIKPNLAPEMRQEAMDKPEVLNLMVQGESGYGDRVLLFVRDDFTNGYDDGWEGSKMTGMSIAPQMYAVSDDGKMSIDAVPEVEGTVIGFRAGQDNNYTFTFRYEGNDVLYLNDMLTETSTRIHEGFSYDFTTADGDIETRFVISHTPFVKTTPTGMDNVQGDEGQSVRKLFYQGVMYIIRGGRIYNAEGARIQ